MKPSDLAVTDLFCGAGGSSSGAEAAGLRLLFGANHWNRAIETHSTNFPHADHLCADVYNVHPRRFPSTHVLIASPECSNHSQAKTRRQQATLFDPHGADEAERSRATMMDVPRLAEYHDYEIVVVENVVEVIRWAGFYPWITYMHNLGYDHEVVCLNSLVAHPTPQSRDRFYCVFWKRGNRKPNLEFRPRSFCPQCEADVEGIQTWKHADRRIGKYRQQYDYRCLSCRGIVYPYAHAAASAIDWNLPTQRIGDRVKPLAPATLRRVEIGLQRFGPAIVQAGGHTWEAPGSNYARTWPLIDPIPTQTTWPSHALALPPFLAVLRTHQDARSLDEVLPTIVAGNVGCAPVEPFIAELRGGRSDVRSIDQPLATVCAAGTHHGLVTPAFYIKNYGRAADAGPMAHGIDEPLGTVTAVDHHALVKMPAQPFLASYYGNGGVTPVGEPVPTVTTRDRHALVNPGIEVDDCGFRMLEPHEIQVAMAFQADYVVTGNKRERVRQLGNAVCPPVMKMILERCAESLS